VCKNKVGRGGDLLSTAGEFFLAQRLSRLFGVLNIAGAAVFPFNLGRNSSGQNLSRRLRKYSLQFLTPDPFGAGIGRTI
jgi:hypothetical protein